MNDVTPIRAAPLPFIDLQAQKRRLNGQIEAAIQRVVDHGQFILGPEVAELERRLAARVGVGHCVLCSSGTDALLIAMMALGIGRGDAVIVPSFTFVASAETVLLAGATPVFVDISENDYNVDARSAQKGFEKAVASGLRPAAIIAVDLFGLPADYDALATVAAAYDATIIADAAQSFGASYRERPVGALAKITATSFYPAKPLGCYGDGGAVLTDDTDLAESLRSISRHGITTSRDEYQHVGLNGRMDTIQAAVLLEKLKIFDDELAARRSVAERYRNGLDNIVGTPHCPDDRISVWAQYTVDLDGRDAIAKRLADQGIPTAVYYPRPIHQQPAYGACLRAEELLPAAETLAERVLSLPIHPYLESSAQDRIIDALRSALAQEA